MNMVRLHAHALLLLLLLCGCDSANSRRVKVAKVISEKLASTEQRMSFDAFDSKNAWRSRASTVYYLIAEDGTVLEVTLKEYAKARVGNTIESSDWE